jgi:uncharacterized protein (TIGR02266 family)
VKLGMRAGNESGSGWVDGAEIVIVKRSDPAGVEPRAPRIEVMLAVSIESESNFYAGFIENFSECGIFVATHAPLKLGSSVDLSIALPKKEPIRARGTVKWLRSYSEENETVPGMGIRFDDLSMSDAERIHEFARARAPMFFDDETERTEQIAAL